MRVSFLTRLSTAFLTAAVLLSAAAANSFAQGGDRLTSMQREIERQRPRLSSAEGGERRDALMKLPNLKRPDPSRIAGTGFNDAAPLVRVPAAHPVFPLR